MAEEGTAVPLLDLLGVPVRIRCADPELAERLNICYARSVSTVDLDTPLEASLQRERGGWRIRVAGLPDQLQEDPVSAVRTFNHELLHGVMRRAPHLYYVHAAVVDVDGRGVVLPGLSQAGKSTLALALVLGGARFVSDELLAFDPERQTAHAFPRAIKIRDVCTSYFPEIQEHFIGHGEGRFLPFSALPEDAVRAETPVRAVVVPRWAEGASSEPMPISRGQALLDLAASSLNFGTHRERSVDWLAAIAGGVTAHRLEWSDPRAAAERIAALARS